MAIGDVSCGVCQKDLYSEPSGLVHTFHHDCIQNWINDQFENLVGSGDGADCPLCCQVVPLRSSAEAIWKIQRAAFWSFQFLQGGVLGLLWVSQIGFRGENSLYPALPVALGVLMCCGAGTLSEWVMSRTLDGYNRWWGTNVQERHLDKRLLAHTPEELEAIVRKGWIEVIKPEVKAREGFVYPGFGTPDRCLEEAFDKYKIKFPSNYNAFCHAPPESSEMEKAVKHSLSWLIDREFLTLSD